MSTAPLTWSFLGKAIPMQAWSGSACACVSKQRKRKRKRKRKRLFLCVF
jgi:hypothetical protein